jgi:integrase/recombinase XerD
MKQARLLKKDEFKRVLAIIGAHKHSERNRIIFYLSFYAGLRACEIASLRISDVIDGNNTVKAEVVLEASMTKGSERQRVMLSTTLQKHLQRYIDAYSASTALDKPLLRSQKGGAFTALTITQLFAKFYDKAGIAGASSHSGRRQFITTLAEKQVNVRVIQALARHKHLNTTMRYIDINDVKLQNAVEAVEF